MSDAISITPEQALSQRDQLLQTIEGEFATTKKVLAAVPDDKADYRPDPKARTARELAWHIACNEVMFLAGIAAKSFEQTEDLPNATSNTAEMVAWYEENFRAGVAKLRQLSGEHLAEPVNFYGAFTLPVVQYLNFLTSHSIHHRGQLSVYLRPMGAKVPAIYGPSADEMWGSEEAMSA